MAYRLWNQISSIKYLKHGTLRTYTSLGDRSPSFIKKSKKQQDWFLQSSSVSGFRNFSASKESPSDLVSTKWMKQGRFVRSPPATVNPSEPRPSLRSRIHGGTKRVSKMAQNHYQKARGLATPYRLKYGSDPTAHEDQIKAMKRAYARKVQVARLQPHSLVPFCSKNAEKFEREDLRPHKFVVHKVQREQGEYVATREGDDVSVTSEISNATNATTKTVETTDSAPSTSETPKEKSTKYHVGYNFTKFNTGTRQFSTFLNRANDRSHGIADALENVNVIQTRTLIPLKCKGEKYKKKTPKDWDKDCCLPKGHVKKAKAKKVYKHKGRWDKCECCPEMLDCDEPICTTEYPFPCPCDKYPAMCPIDCPPPCEPPPPPCAPLCRPPKCPRYQKVVECTHRCSPRACTYVGPKCLPKLRPQPCPCIEPYLPDKLPPMKLVKKRIYQCQPCPLPPCCVTCKDCVIIPKCLPPIVPGDCPCVEPIIHDVPPLKRLKMDPFQKVKECKPGCIIEKVKVPNCVEQKCLPPIKSDCYCIEPKPLKPVRLVRLPKICLCPPPPDQKCYPKPCPPRADEVCCWEFPKKKLRDFWCPNCKIPSKKYKFCRVHTRCRGVCKRRPKKPAHCKMACKMSCDERIGLCKPKTSRRKMSTVATLRYCRDCQSVCMGAHTYTVRNFSTAGNSAMNMEAGTSTQAKPATMLGSAGIRPLKLANALPFATLREFHTTPNMDSRHRKKKRCKKVRCPHFENNCCPPKCREDCEPRLRPLCCKPRKSPYPAFSECGEFHQLLTCECKRVIPHLQPNTPFPNVKKLILPESRPKHKIIDPLLEEHCVLADLCRPFGHTYTCENFHEGEVVPLAQYECFSPHRLPCCERDQICDFRRRPLERKCDGHPKGPEFYRCECHCPPRKKCPKKKLFEMESVYSKIKKRRPRYYSTMAGCPRINSTESNSTKPNIMAMSTRAYSKVGGKSGWPKCPRCPRRDKTCGQPMRGNRRLDIFRKRFKPKPGNEVINRELKAHFKKSIECQGPVGRKRILLEQARCAAKAVGMKLVHDHDHCCKHKTPCTLEGRRCSQGGCSGMPECKRPKNVCETCTPRYEVDQCKGVKQVAPCCCMPYRKTGVEFRSIQPACCKMPIPLCNRKCMRVRGDCLKEYFPCCITESPYPAFSDCHPPFKRLIRGELQWQEWLEDRTRRKINSMLQNIGHHPKSYSTAAHLGEVSLLDRMLSCLDRKEDTKGLHEPVNCECSPVRKMTGFKDIKPDLRRDIKTALPSTSGIEGISNIPEMLFNKDDIFKEVDSENLISLAPKEMTPMEKLKCYLFNKANKGVGAAGAIKLPVDGFECFVRSVPNRSCKTISGTKSSRNYSVAKIEVEEIKDPAEENSKEIVESPLQMKNQPDVLLSEPTDLVYLMNDGTTAINLRPKPTPNKVKVIPHPVCTHIMLDSGELMLEHEYHLMNTMLPLKNRLYLPFGLTHEEYLTLEEESLKTVQEQLEKMLQENA